MSFITGYYQQHGKVGKPMPSCIFRYRRSHDEIKTSFLLTESSKDMADYLVGDTVHISFSGQSDKQKAIESFLPGGATFTAIDGYIQIPCVIVQRKHSLLCKHGVYMEKRTSTIVLEAETDTDEQILLWMLLDQKPMWVFIGELESRSTATKELKRKD